MRHLSGGDGNREITIALYAANAIENDTDQEYEIHYGFDTVANGRADEIMIQPGEIAQRTYAGSAHDFARWKVGEKQEFPPDLRIAKVSEIVEPTKARKGPCAICGGEVADATPEGEKQYCSPCIYRGRVKSNE